MLGLGKRRVCACVFVFEVYVEGRGAGGRSWGFTKASWETSKRRRNRERERRRGTAKESFLVVAFSGVVFLCLPAGLVKEIKSRPPLVDKEFLKVKKSPSKSCRVSKLQGRRFWVESLGACARRAEQLSCR